MTAYTIRSVIQHNTTKSLIDGVVRETLDFTPAVICLSKVFEKEVNFSVVHWFRKELGIKLPEFFKDEEELRKIWSSPITRKILLEQLAEAGFAKDELSIMQSLIDAAWDPTRRSGFLRASPRGRARRRNSRSSMIWAA